MLTRLIGEDVELKTICPSGLRSVKADPGQIEQVIMNLAVNARDAMPHGGKLTIETSNVDLDENYCNYRPLVAPGAYVMLAVSDTGIGMTPEIQSRIFEPFYTTKEQGKGTGLGLATVYGIVKQSGGYVWVYSEAGNGTTFKIYLPYVQEASPESKPKVEIPRATTGSETILLVEDDESVRSFVCGILETRGYTLLGSGDSEEALQLARNHLHSIHLLLTDVVLPRMKGPELAARLAPLHPETRVLYMSGYTDNAVVHQGLSNVGTNFLQKPFDPETLARRVRDVLDE
jgi:two-component system cell cycle sensor histidine kinase/response regulator CckA